MTDPLDAAILRVLSLDARATYAQVGQQVSLSAPAVKRRVDRLREQGVIRGFTVRLDPAALGWQTERSSSCSATARRALRRCAPRSSSTPRSSRRARSPATSTRPAGPGPRHAAPRAGRRTARRRAVRLPHALDRRALRSRATPRRRAVSGARRTVRGRRSGCSRPSRGTRHGAGPPGSSSRAADP